MQRESLRLARRGQPLLAPSTVRRHVAGHEDRARAVLVSDAHGLGDRITTGDDQCAAPVMQLRPEVTEAVEEVRRAVRRLLR